jgi:hypothetical protein
LHARKPATRAGAGRSDREKSSEPLVELLRSIRNPTCPTLAYARFQLNRAWLDKEATAAAALKRIKEILDAAAPYGMLKDAEALIRTVEGVNTALVDQHRKQAIEDIEDQISKVQLELNEAKASGDLSNQCLLPLQSLKRQVESQTSIAHIDQAPGAAVELADDAFRKIEAAVQQTSKSGVHDDTGKQYVKRRVVKAAALAPKNLLATQEDVDGYLDKLRHALEAAIEAGERVEIR